MPLPIGSTPFTDDDLKAIGEVVVAGALLEAMFDFCIWSLIQSQPHPDVGFAITGGLRTSSKIQVLGVLGRIQLEDEELDEFIHALGNAGKLIGERNDIVHGTAWDFGETEEVVRYLRVHAKKDVEFKLIEISKERIAQLSSELGHARTRIYRAVEPFRKRTFKDAWEPPLDR